MEWDDGGLCSAIAGGDPRAEEELCRRFRARIRRTVWGALRGRPECDDVTSEILVSTLARLRSGGFRGECQLATFVHAVTRNKICEFLRRKRPETSELNEEIPDGAESPEDAVAREEARDAVREALSRLPQKYRDVLRLFYYEGLTVAEIAARLGLPARRISERKDYALKVFRARFGESLSPFR